MRAVYCSAALEQAKWATSKMSVLDCPRPVLQLGLSHTFHYGDEGIGYVFDSIP